MKFLIVAAGEATDYNWFENEIKKYNPDKIICVDGGAKHLREVGLFPDVLIGDFDSIDKKDYEYLKNKLYEFIKLGECPPEIYSEFIDRHESIFRKQILYADYGIIENLDTTLIDKNRKAIGIPSIKHKQKIGRDRHAFKDLVETL